MVRCCSKAQHLPYVCRGARAVADITIRQIPSLTGVSLDYLLAPTIDNNSFAKMERLIQASEEATQVPRTRAAWHIVVN